jgi:hypothetical protein
MKIATFRYSLLILMALLISPVTYGAELLVNGDFESGLEPWRGLNFEIVEANDNNVVHLNVDDAGSIGQTIPTLRGVTYTVSFDVSPDPGCDAEYLTLKAALFTGNQETTAVLHNVPRDENYNFTTHAFTFQGSGRPMTLSFISKTPGTCGTVIDNASVVEPDTIEDQDGDGVADNVDMCPDTEQGVVVNALGCSGDQTAELDCGCYDFPNHGQYIACIKRVAVELQQYDVISGAEAAKLIREAARSSCGR